MAHLPAQRRRAGGLSQGLSLRLRHTEFFGHFEGRCDVAGFSLARMNASAPVEPHEHDDGHFIVVLAGHYRSSARGADQLLGPGDMLWNPPGTRHQDCFASPSGRFMTLSVAAPQAVALGLADGPARRLLDAAQHLGASLSQRTEAVDLGSLLDTEAHCLQLCALTAGEHVADVAPRSPPSWLRRCMERLIDDAAQSLRLGDLAAEAGVHPVSLARAFRRHYGLSPGQLQRRAQLNRAAALLRGGCSPGDAAAACSFADQSHFTRAFRTEYRSTPAVWQARFKTF